MEPRRGGSVHVQHMEFSHQMAAKQVTIKGNMDKEKKTITVTSMEPMAPKKS